MRPSTSEKLRYIAAAVIFAIVVYNIPNLIRLRIFLDAWVMNGAN